MTRNAQYFLEIPRGDARVRAADEAATNEPRLPNHNRCCIGASDVMAETRNTRVSSDSARHLPPYLGLSHSQSKDARGLDAYRAFIASRGIAAERHGFTPGDLTPSLKAHQEAVIRFALERGRSAAFLDTGLGKSLIELEFARQCAEETSKPSLILTPLAVAGQMVREGHRFGIDARQVREQAEVGRGVMIANYERLPKLDADAFGAVVLDESSILKSFAGRTRALLLDAFAGTRFRLAATATPSPNDHTELGNHAEFLGVMRQQEMLSRWFINDTSTASQDWRLKGHAVEAFWSWVATWARCATLPSDLGGDDDGYVLPEIDRRIHTVAADRSVGVDEGMLFRIPEMSATSFHAEKRLTLAERCRLAAELATHDRPVTVWCETNEESAELVSLIPDAVEVHGSLDPDEKERRLLGFADGTYRAIVTKPKLAGFGVNWQHCAHAVFASVSFSYEQHYQAVRRSHRFGQTERVRNDVILADTEASIWAAITAKSAKHDDMKRRMADAMRAAQSEAGRRVRYDRPLDLAFPSWIRSEQ